MVCTCMVHLNAQKWDSFTVDIQPSPIKGAWALNNGSTKVPLLGEKVENIEFK